MYIVVTATCIICILMLHWLFCTLAIAYRFIHVCVCCIFCLKILCEIYSCNGAPKKLWDGIELSQDATLIVHGSEETFMLNIYHTNTFIDYG